MQEISSRISKALLNGLRPDDSIDDSDYLSDCRNLIPVGQSLVPFEPYTTPFFELGDYPFPQYFHFESVDLLLTRTELNRISDLGDVEPLANFTNFEISKPLRALDYGKRWALVGPEITIFDKGVSNKLRANAALIHKNRTIFGGIQGGFGTLTVNKRTLVWSSFDSTDYPFSILDNKPLDEADQLRSQEWGYMEMPFSGEILDMCAAADYLFVFGTNGLAVLKLTDDGYGIVAITRFGIKSRGYCGSNQQVWGQSEIPTVVFIGTDNTLWTWEVGKGLQRLKFQSYMEQLVGHVFITADLNDLSRFYIGDAHNSFILREGKLVRCCETIGSFQTPFVTGTINQWDLESGVLSGGTGAFKTLTGIQIVADRPIQAWAKVKSNNGETPFILVGPDGYAATLMYGTNHKVVIFGNGKPWIESIEVKWQLDDLRHTRGVFVSKA